MKWLVIVIVIMAVVITAAIIAKLRLRRKLKDIDGLNGVHRGTESIIASIGDDTGDKHKGV